MADLTMTSANGGEGPSRATTASTSSTLDEVMRAPSLTAPDVVVLDSLDQVKTRKETLNPKEDLWLSTADGRFNSPITPLRVGQGSQCQTFYVHKNVLLKAEYFRKALCGDFMESQAQSMDLPEEDPAIFHFVIAFLYENKYVPIRNIDSVLIPDEKGKGLDGENDSAASDSDSSAGGGVSDTSSARSRRFHERRRRREDRHWETLREKHPNTHRIGCGCRQCMTSSGPPCWNCSAPRLPPPPPPMPAVNGPMVIDERPRTRNNRRRRIPSPPLPMLPTMGGRDEERIKGEDLRTWLLTYNMNLDVYICANKFLLEDFKAAIARVCIDMLEIAGSDAAQPEVLQLCSKLYEGLSESDPLLKMIFARVGFLQPVLWKRAPQETSEFLLNHPEVSALILKETATRREEDFAGGASLPAMERAIFPNPLDVYYSPRAGPVPRPGRF